MDWYSSFRVYRRWVIGGTDEKPSVNKTFFSYWRFLWASMETRPWVAGCS